MNEKTQPGLLESALEILRQATSGHPYANQAQLARATGENEPNISRWLNGTSTPTLRKLEPVLMTLGVRFTLPGETVPEPSQNSTPLWERKADSWKILERPAPPPPILALTVRPDDTSMQPTLRPGDVVIIDTEQKELHSGQVYLVRQPEKTQGPCVFRRVCLQQRGGLGILVLNPDNLAEGHEPLIRYIYNNEPPNNLIIGRALQCIRNLKR